jgi:hypothetical protein
MASLAYGRQKIRYHDAHLDVSAALEEEVDELFQPGSLGLGRQKVDQRLLLGRVQMELEQLVHASSCSSGAPPCAAIAR